MPLQSVLLEFSEDDLSDTTPTWQNVTSDLQDIEWWAGVDREGDDPKPGGATIRLKSTSRRWEPDFVAGEFYPNVTYGRRFRLTLNDGLGAVQEGLWYITDIGIDYPAGTGYSEVTMTCADGSEVLALDDLPQMDPPDATSYEDVINFDDPWGYWRLGDPEGTRARPNLVLGRRFVGTTEFGTYAGHVAKQQTIYRRRKFKTRRGTNYRIRSETGAVAGPAGNYVGLPIMGESSLILGDVDTCVQFSSKTVGANAYVKIPMDDNPFSDNNKLSLSVWARPQLSPGSTKILVAGPFSTAASANTFSLSELTSGLTRFTVQLTSAVAVTATSTTDVSGESHHLGATWDGQNARIYVDGVLEATTNTAGQLRTGNASDFIYVGGGGSPVAESNAAIDEVALFEHVLPDSRFQAHYQAGSARGYPQQTAGARIADIATHALWSEASIQTTGRDVQPEFKHGQPKLEEIAELAHAEGQRAMFFFNGSGDPVYLGHEWQAGSASYNTVQVTLGDTAAEVKYDGIEPQYDNETYNEVTATHESGEAVTVGTGTPPPRRANTEFTDVLLMEHNHVESLANAVLAFYEDPQLRFTTVSLNGADTTRLNHILRRDIGHLIRVKKSGLSGARIDRVANIIGKRKHYDFRADLLTCTWNLGRGFNAADGFWHAGIEGFSNAGVSTVAA